MIRLKDRRFEKRRWSDGELGLQEMCDFGVEHRGDETLEFNVFNKVEFDFVREYMRAQHSTVPYRVTRIV